MLILGLPAELVDRILYFGIFSRALQGSFASFRSKIWPGLFEGAAAGDGIDMVQLALYPPSRAIRPPNANSVGDDREASVGETAPNAELVIGLEAPGL